MANRLGHRCVCSAPGVSTGPRGSRGRPLVLSRQGSRLTRTAAVPKTQDNPRLRGNGALRCGCMPGVAGYTWLQPALAPGGLSPTRCRPPCQPITLRQPPTLSGTCWAGVRHGPVGARTGWPQRWRGCATGGRVAYWSPYRGQPPRLRPGGTINGPAHAQHRAHRRNHSRRRSHW